jgi:hypothetical protein
VHDACGVSRKALSHASQSAPCLALPAPQLPDLKLDVPDAASQLATFMARAVVDDCLPPSVVAAVQKSQVTAACSQYACMQGQAGSTTPSCLHQDAGPEARELYSRLEGLLAARHGAEALTRCWESGQWHPLCSHAGPLAV